MHALRPLFASVLLAVFAGGGVLVPAWHDAVHGLEQAEERAEHTAEHHADAADMPLAQAPCPPAPHDVDCAVCAGLTTAAEVAVGPVLPPDAESSILSAEAERVKTSAAFGAGARGPPTA